jgi:hypothetical protein
MTALYTTNEASPQTDKSCIVPSHNGWRDLLIDAFQTTVK